METQEENRKALESGFSWQDQYCMHQNAMVVENHCRVVLMLRPGQSYSTSTRSSRACIYSSFTCIFKQLSRCLLANWSPQMVLILIPKHQRTMSPLSPTAQPVPANGDIGECCHLHLPAAPFCPPHSPPLPESPG